MSQLTRILLVEDHVDTAKALAYLLRKQGYEVRRAGSLTEAMAISASGWAPDVLVSDICLPDGSGLELPRRLRPPASVAITALANDSDVRAGHDAGFAEYLVKPFVAQALYDTIRRVIPRRRSPRDDDADPNADSPASEPE